MAEKTVTKSYLPYMVGLQALSGAVSSYQQGQTSKAISKTNERLGNMRAEAARRKGYDQENLSRQKIRQGIGSQRTGYAGQNVRVNEGSPSNMQAETAIMGELDALTIKNNAARAAFGYESESLSASLEGKLSYQSGVTSAIDTLLTGGIKAYDYGKRYGW